MAASLHRGATVGAMSPAAEPTGRLVLVRHGETEWSRDGRHTGRTDVPLTAMPGSATPAGSPPCWPASTSRSCCPHRWRGRVRTAQLAGLDPTTDDDLVEWDYGDYEGRTTPRDPRVAGRTRAGRSSPTGSCPATPPARPSRRSPPEPRGCSTRVAEPLPARRRRARRARPPAAHPRRHLPAPGRALRRAPPARRGRGVRARARARGARHPVVEPDRRPELSRRARGPR